MGEGLCLILLQRSKTLCSQQFRINGTERNSLPRFKEKILKSLQRLHTWFQSHRKSERLRRDDASLPAGRHVSDGMKRRSITSTLGPLCFRQ
ncbi:hypothetical protein F2P81_015852 [Scophthalmus maximus]|uniref:Uncharacterized protein n=1 Tax=Scophthalmus maximus TaxID=52904 RepID=A0A6A4SDK3_SCOMX|nr:hypothetical protein F2P81_015852 [Scophthalmus maximus]